MKKYFYLIIILAFIACETTDNGDTPTTKTIIESGATLIVDNYIPAQCPEGKFHKKTGEIPYSGPKFFAIKISGETRIFDIKDGGKLIIYQYTCHSGGRGGK